MTQDISEREAIRRRILGLYRVQDMYRDPIKVANIQRDIERLEAKGEALRVKEER